MKIVFFLHCFYIIHTVLSEKLFLVVSEEPTSCTEAVTNDDVCRSRVVMEKHLKSSSNSAMLRLLLCGSNFMDKKWTMIYGI